MRSGLFYGCLPLAAGYEIYKYLKCQTRDPFVFRCGIGRKPVFVFRRGQQNVEPRLIKFLLRYAVSETVLVDLAPHFIMIDNHGIPLVKPGRAIGRRGIARPGHAGGGWLNEGCRPIRLKPYSTMSIEDVLFQRVQDDYDPIRPDHEEHEQNG